MKKLVFVSTVVCGSLLVIALWSLLGVSKDENVKADEQQIRELVQRIPIGASPTEVENVFNSLGSSRLKLQQIDSSNWLITTPMRFGAINWDLWILFSEGKVQSLKVRLADSKAMHPPRAPSDKS